MTVLKQWPGIVAICLVANCLFPSNVGAFELTFFSPDTFSTDTAAMDEALGISGFEIEDFEDVTLIPGLSMTYSGRIPDKTIATLPSLQEVYTGIAWDGRHVFSNIPDNTLKSRSVCTDCVRLTTFNFDGGVSSVGIGLGNFQPLHSPAFPTTDHLLFINGTPLAKTLEILAGENFVPGIVDRNVYLRIDAEPGERIESIGFQNISHSRVGFDYLEFDRLAVDRATRSVPEPAAAIALLTTGAIVTTQIRSKT